MKFSTMTAVLATVLAFAVSGCRYNKVNADEAELEGSNLGGLDETMEASEVETTENDPVVSDSALGANGNAGDQGLVTDSGVASGHFDDLYARCQDVAFEPVFFKLDSSVVPQSELAKIDLVVSHLQQMPNRVVIVEGHCDERGSNEYNMSLGENRAMIIRGYLLQNGITEDRVQTRSYGEEKPLVPGSGEAAWSRNRRGEFAIFQK